MDTLKVDFQEEMKVDVENLLIKIENEKREPARPGNFDKETSQDVCFESQFGIQEVIDIKIEDKVEIQPGFEDVEYEFGLCTGVHSVEQQEMGQPNPEEPQNEVKFSLKTYIKSEPTTIESDEGKPVNQLQNSKCSEDTIKEESFAETEFLIQENVNIKSEEDEESNQYNSEPRVETEEWLHAINETDSLEPPVFRCFNCDYQTHQKQLISHHVLNHTKTAFKCPHCPYQTWNSCYLEKHRLVHAPKEEDELHKCPKCPFTSKRKRALTRHLLVHKNLNEVTWFQCSVCPYKSKRKADLMHRHMLVHSKDAFVHKCSLCSFESHRNDTLKRHLRRMHRSEDIELIGCPEEGCLFKTHEKYYLTRHIKVMHKSNKVCECPKCYFGTKSPHELGPGKWFSCLLCPYKTTSTTCLNDHALVHDKSDSEVKWFHCSECLFKTKHKRNLNQHKLSHNRVFEMMFECSECPYKTPIAVYYRRHLLKHKDPASKTWFQCPQCLYKTTRRDKLKQHSYTHKSVDEIQEWFGCPTCPYKTHTKFLLKRHQLVHRKPDEITDWYHCFLCACRTRRKESMVKHIRDIHRDAEGRICNSRTGVK